MLSLSLTTLSILSMVASAANLQIPISKRFAITDDSGVANMAIIDAAFQVSTTKYQRNEMTRLENLGVYVNTTASIEKRQRAALQMQNNGMLWTGSVGFGTPPVYLPINFDTGSDDLWVAGYQPSSSSSAEVVDSDSAAFKIAYADGSGAQGPIYKETINVGGLNVRGQIFSPVSSTSGMSGRPDAGMCGLAFQALSKLNAPNIVESLFSQGTIPAKIFSFALKRSAGASLCLGCIDQTAISAPIQYTPVLDAAYWLVHGDVYIERVSNNAAVSSTQGMIIDTGTTLLVGPADAVTHLWSLVPGVQVSSVGAGYYDADCNAIPLVSLDLGGRKYQIPASGMNLGQTYGGSGRCVLALVGGHTGVTDWIVGDAFLSHVYSTFDYDNNRVGFAPLA